MDGLRQIISDNVDLAFEMVNEALWPVQWTFVSSAASLYDPVTDQEVLSTVVHPLTLLTYSDERSDQQFSFSSKGNFIDAAVEQDTFKVLVRAKDMTPFEPSISDSFVRIKTNERFNVRSLERIPYDVVYLMTVGRA